MSRATLVRFERRLVRLRRRQPVLRDVDCASARAVRRDRRAERRRQDDAAPGDRSGSCRRSTGQVSVDGSGSLRARRHRGVGYVPQVETVDWNFPVTVSGGRPDGRWAEHRAGAPGPPRGDRRRGRTRCSSGSASADSPAATSASSPAASSSGSFLARALIGEPAAPPPRRADRRRRHQDARRHPAPARRAQRATASRSS